MVSFRRRWVEIKELRNLLLNSRFWREERGDFLVSNGKVHSTVLEVINKP
jgi:hypothetical protein